METKIIRIYAHPPRSHMIEAAKEAGLSEEAANFFRCFSEISIDFTVEIETGKVINVEAV